MLMTFSTKSPLEYQHISLNEQQNRGILGRLVGPMASFKDATRNGRKYTEKLWDKTFSNPIIIEKLENKCLFGELGHPAERTEIDIEKIAICLAEMPKKGDDGNIYGVFDILNTPNGRILKTMCDYGCNIGISSRGNGDVTEDWDGNETVDAESYDLECFDAVLLPAVKAARLTYVTESLDTSKKSLKQALNEALENASDTEKEIMKETLDNLEIDYKSEPEVATEDVAESVEENNIEEAVEEIQNTAADDNGAIIKELQEALQKQVELELQIKSLQEKLSVCYTKEARYAKILESTNADLSAANSATEAEKANSEKLVEKLEHMKSIISEQNVTIKSLNETIKKKDSAYTELNENLSRSESLNRKLTEGVNAKDKDIKSLNESLIAEKTRLNESIETLKKQNIKLNESLQDAKKDSQIIKSEANAKITKCNQLTEKYKSIAKTAVDRYIECKATTLGISVTEIKNRLKENYSFNDIEKVCEDLQRYKLNMRALPFDINSKNRVKMKINESKNIIDPAVSDNGVDDEIDEALSSFMN